MSNRSITQKGYPPKNKTAEWLNNHSFDIIYLSCLFIIINYYLEIKHEGGHPWKTGDWLINYTHGLVRRGLIGEILLRISNLGISLLWITFATQSLIYIYLYHLVRKFCTNKERPVEWIILTLSPAYVLFPFYDTAGGFRKEILVFLSFCIILESLINNKNCYLKLFIGYLIYFLACFSHEISAFTLPFFIYAIWIGYRQNVIKKIYAFIYSVLFILTALLAFYIALRYPGDSNTAFAICNSIIQKGLTPHTCSGAIEWLSRDAKYGYTAVAGRITQYLSYLPLFIISITPIFLIENITTSLKRTLFIGFLFTTPLYFVATDWGRWIYIFTFFAFTLIQYENTLKPLHIRQMSPVVILTYLCTWRVPHFGGYLYIFYPALFIAPLRLIKNIINSI